MSTKEIPKNYIFSILAICVLITISLQIYLPILNYTQGVVGMFIFNIIGVTLVHNFCDRTNIQEFSLRDITPEVKIIFYCQLMILIQLFLFVFLYTFFDIKRESIIDLVVLLIVQGYLFIRGDEYSRF
jgi:hypothetical protein